MNPLAVLRNAEMFGRIYPNPNACNICKGKFSLFDDKRLAHYCPEHPDQVPRRYIYRTTEESKSFKSWDKAFRYQIKITEMKESGEYNPKKSLKKNTILVLKVPFIQQLNIEASNPDKRKRKITKKTVYNMDRWITDAGNYFPNTHILDIDTDDWNRFFTKTYPELSNKSKADIRSAINRFYEFLILEGTISRTDKPELPKFKRGKSQHKYFADLELRRWYVWELAFLYPTDHKLILSAHFSATYMIRPEELRNLRETDFNLNTVGAEFFTVWDDKKKGDKPFFLINKHVPIIKEMLRNGQSNRYFFNRENKQYSKDYIYRKWEKVYKSLLNRWNFISFIQPVRARCSIVWIPPYPSLKHLSATLAKTKFGIDRTQEAIQHDSITSTGKYILPDSEQAQRQKQVYQLVAPDLPDQFVQFSTIPDPRPKRKLLI